MRSPAIQTYSAAYKQAKRDIEIEEEKAARIKTDQLEGLRRKEKRALPRNGPIKRKDYHASGSVVGGRVTSYHLIRGHPHISAAGRNLLVHQLEIHGEGMT